MKSAVAALLAIAPLLAQADGGSRPATAAEKAYMLKVRAACTAALAGTTRLDWTVRFETPVVADATSPLDAGKQPYAMEFELTLALDRDSKRADEFQARYEEALKADPAKPGVAYGLQVLNQETAPSIHVYVNVADAQFTLLTEPGGQWQPAKIAGAAQALRITHAQALTGGGDDKSGEVTALFLGAWGKPVFDDNYDALKVPATLKAGANPLAVQNAWLRIEAPPALADELIAHIDLAALRALIK